MSSPVQNVGSVRNLSYSKHPDPADRSRIGCSEASSRTNSVALSVEFVAKPEKARSAPALLPQAIHGALKEVTGFAGCVVLSSDQEARLITVITFWRGSDCQKHCSANVRWVRALVASYVDSCLRVRTMVAHAPMLTQCAAETNDAETGLMLEETAPAEETEENVCVA